MFGFFRNRQADASDGLEKRQVNNLFFLIKNFHFLTYKDGPENIFAKVDGPE